MVSKTLLAGSALAAAASAATLPIDPACSAIQAGLPSFPTQSASISSFCSSFFHISTATTTTTSTVTESRTSTSNVAATTTVTPTSTTYTTTSTCYTSPTGSVAKRTAEAQFPTSFPMPPTPSQAVSSACSCAGVTVSPTVTATRTATSTTYVATVTSTTGTSTVTASPVTVTAASTQTVPPSATYTAPAGTRFLDYLGYDFYGNDLASSYCGANGAFTVPGGRSVNCTDFAGCQNACEAYNAAVPGRPCIGASYLVPNTYCYLKNTINDCTVMPNGNVNSGAVA